MRGHRVVVSAENDERVLGPPLRDEKVRLVPRVLGHERGRDQLQNVLANRSFAPAGGRNVDQLERPRGEAVGERGHGAERTGA